MDNENEKYIFTCNAKSRKLALYELEKYDESFRFIRWMDEEIGLFESAMNNEELCRCVREKPVIFVRHLFRVNGIGSRKDCVEDIVAECRSTMERGAAFTVQTRRAKGVDSGASAGGGTEVGAEQRNGAEENSIKNVGLQADDMTERLADRLAAEGYRVDAAGGEYIISVLIEDEMVYWGIGSAGHNLSHWKGGMPHYSPTAEFGFVSRAEYKLLEALECFGIDLKGMERAADLGAAPGGWTKVLTEKGLECTSIDPSYLKPEIVRNGKVRYYHMTVEEYLRSERDERFEIVVNDMKMDMAKSVNVVNAFYDRLREGGIVIMTFKLPHEYSYSDILRTLQQLNGFVLIGARQLFHNRYEITVAVRKEGTRREHADHTDRGAFRASQRKGKGAMSKKLERKMQRKRQNKGGRAAADKNRAVN